MLAKLYKLAYNLDRNGHYGEAAEIEEVMKSMAERVGLSAEDMVALADHFDQIGDIATADMFDKMIKESKKKTKPKAPKKWWDKMIKEIKENSPDYSEERVVETLGEIWYNNLSDKKRKEILKRYKK